MLALLATGELRQEGSGFPVPRILSFPGHDGGRGKPLPYDEERYKKIGRGKPLRYDEERYKKIGRGKPLPYDGERYKKIRS